MKKEDIKRYFEKIAELNKELNEDDKKEYIGMLLKECVFTDKIMENVVEISTQDIEFLDESLIFSISNYYNEDKTSLDINLISYDLIEGFTFEY